VPVVAYAGTEDEQMQAAKNVLAKLKPLDIPMTLIEGTGLKHEFPPEMQKKAEAAYAKWLEPGKSPYPAHVHFVTYTTKYPACAWVDVLGMDRHYERTLVDASQTDAGFTVKTANVRDLRLALAPGIPRQPIAVTIDDQKVSARPAGNAGGNLQLYLARRDGQWTSVLPERLQTDRLRRPQKTSNLQGPIDDAFTGPFLCVRGTGQPWHEATAKYVEGDLKRFKEEWDRFFRGELEVKDDADVTAEDVAGNHLILFGDPSSNSLIAQVLDGLPLKWTKEQIALGDKTYPAGQHVPALIYPSPLNPQRYVVLNSGHTFHAKEFLETNAQLYPRLGDYAVLKPAPTDKDALAAEVVTAGLFDDFWQPAKK
jgi:hypothetical protein